MFGICMNRIGFSVFVCGAMTIASQAHAQNSVSLYGIVDTGFLYVHNSGGKANQISMVSGGESSGRWGLKGSEDLGGGLSTIFKLESGYDSTNGRLGQGGKMF